MDEAVPQELIDAGRGYESLFVPALFETWTKHLVDGAGIGEGMHVLDVACGTGVLARHALARTGANGRVVGADPAPGMLAAAREREPAIDWRLCGAEALDVDDDAFDCIVSQFGMMFFEDRSAAAHEMRRALRPRGMLAVAVWDAVDNNPAYGDIIDVLEENVSTAAADALRLPFSLGDAGEVTGVLADSGFGDIQVETRQETARFPSTRHMVEAELRGWLPLFDIHLDEDKIGEVLAESERALSRYAADSGEAVFPTSAHIITARKP